LRTIRIASLCIVALGPLAAAGCVYDTSSNSSSQQPLAVSRFDGETLMRGIFFGTGPAASLLPELWDPPQGTSASRLSPEVKAEVVSRLRQRAAAARAAATATTSAAANEYARRLEAIAAVIDKDNIPPVVATVIQRVMERIRHRNPAFFETFANEMQSGAHTRVRAALVGAANMLLAVTSTEVDTPGPGGGGGIVLAGATASAKASATDTLIAVQTSIESDLNVQLATQLARANMFAIERSVAAQVAQSKAAATAQAKATDLAKASDLAQATDLSAAGDRTLVVDTALAVETVTLNAVVNATARETVRATVATRDLSAVQAEVTALDAATALDVQRADSIALIDAVSQAQMKAQAKALEAQVTKSIATQTVIENDIASAKSTLIAVNVEQATQLSEMMDVAAGDSVAIENSIAFFHQLAVALAAVVVKSAAWVVPIELPQNEGPASPLRLEMLVESLVQRLPR